MTREQQNHYRSVHDFYREMVRKYPTEQVRKSELLMFEVHYLQDKKEGA